MPSARSGQAGEPRADPRRWYLLIHQLPPRPLYLRARILRRLLGAGAVALKNSVYALPQREECLEALESIAGEAIERGGDAYICSAEFPDASVEDALVGRFQAERNADYEGIQQSLRSARNRPVALARSRKRFDETRKIDFFGASLGERVEERLRALESADRQPGVNEGEARGAGRTWVTRRNIHVDRIASAWLIRGFIDRKAGFRFVDPKERGRPGELSFDMPGGDFTHDGDRCTFETLVARFGLADRALQEVAEIVHDIDLKDAKFGRTEAAGLERILTGLVLTHPDDQARLESGFALFDQLYESFRKHVGAVSKEGRR